MKRTARLITTIAAIVLTIVIMSVGIYAATKLTLTPTGSNIKFTAKDVAATITGTKQMGTNTAETLTIPNNGVFTASYEQGKDYSGTVELGDIEFTDISAAYTLTLTVKNDFTETPINVTYSAGTDTTDYVVIATKTTSSAEGAAAEDYTNSTPVTLAAGATITITTTITVNSANTETILEKGFDNVPFNFTLDVARVSTSA